MDSFNFNHVPPIVIILSITPNSIQENTEYSIFILNLRCIYTYIFAFIMCIFCFESVQSAHEEIIISTFKSKMDFSECGTSCTVNFKERQKLQFNWLKCLQFYKYLLLCIRRARKWNELGKRQGMKENISHYLRTWKCKD